MANSIKILNIVLNSKDYARVKYQASVFGTDYKPKVARLRLCVNGWEAEKDGNGGYGSYHAFCTWQGNAKMGGLSNAARKWIEPRVIEALKAYASPEHLANADRESRNRVIACNNLRIAELEKELMTLRDKNARLA